jgi:heme exporter protein D
MSGVVAGGWGFVTAAYTVTVLVLLGYTVSVLLRHRIERRRADRERPLER